MDMPLVSVIIPVYKVEKYLRTCLDSVLGQSYPNWELIIVDDGSPDRCGDICDEYARKDSRIIALHQSNAGQSSARNRALDNPPHGEFVTFLDSDDYLHKDYLKTLVDLQQEYQADLVQCGFVHGTATTFPELKEASSVSFLDNHSVFLREKANVIMWGKLFRCSLFEGIRMPVGLYNEDDWTAWKLYYRAKTIVVTDQRLYYYTINPASTMARLGKKPDLRYVNAYNERIGFFIQTGEEDLEHCSRLQLCKSLLLNYSNTKLTGEERRDIKGKFDGSWKILRRSPYIRMFYKTLFSAFHIMPLITSKMAVKLR